MSFDKFAYQKQLHGVKMNPNYYRVLITLGDYATGATGGDAYPGLERLASGACVSKSTVQRALRYLEDEGWIRRHVSADGRVSRGGRSRDGAHWATKYELAPPDTEELQQVSRDHLKKELQQVKSDYQQVKSEGSTGHSCDHPPDHETPDHGTPDHETHTPARAKTPPRDDELADLHEFAERNRAFLLQAKLRK